MSDEIRNIPINQIVDPASPMRSDFDLDSIKELSESIKTYGLINPITIRPTQNGFEVVAGHRRFRACQLAGQAEIRAVVRTLTDEDTASIMAAENLERQDVDPVDEALFIGKLLSLPSWDIQKVSQKLNRSQQWVEDRLGILDYPDYLIVALKQGQIKLGTAKWLGKITDDMYCRMYVESAIKNGMSVVQAQYAYNQFEMGLMPSADTIMPPPSELVQSERARARAMCAKCNSLAVEPNLRTVWIHVDCNAPQIESEPTPLSPALETPAPAPA